MTGSSSSEKAKARLYTLLAMTSLKRALDEDVIKHPADVVVALQNLSSCIGELISKGAI